MRHHFINAVFLAAAFTLAACSPEFSSRPEMAKDAAPQASRTSAEQRIMAAPEPAPQPLISPGAPLPNTTDSLSNLRQASEPADRENYAPFESNPIKRVAEEPVSTFSIDVDTGSYANVRRILRDGRLPPSNAVRIEEMINYFNFDYPAPETRSTPFQVTTELGPSPWNSRTRMLLVGLQGYSVPVAELPPANLVFLLDVSGSMDAPDKLPLLKSALSLLTQQLRPEDSVSIVVYAGASGLVLAPTSRRDLILNALNQLSAGGSTNGGEGIQLAYQVAEQAFIPNGVNRVLLATDGDFNVGTVNFEALKDLITAKRKSGIALTTLGFGTGNYNDHLMEQLADVGNGNYAYIDSLQEARKTLVQELGSTLLTIAKDVKIQIEFNPAVVEEYRLIGYENRLLRREDFNNDAVDAGEIGAGHSVTALYEIALRGSGGAWSDPLRYQTEAINADSAAELAYLKLRYKMPDSERSELMQYPVYRAAADVKPSANSSERLRFACAVAAFGQYLRGGEYLNGMNLPAIGQLAAQAQGADPDGYRSELVQLIGLADSLSGTGPNTNLTN